MFVNIFFLNNSSSNGFHIASETVEEEEKKKQPFGAVHVCSLWILYMCIKYIQGKSLPIIQYNIHYKCKGNERCVCIY